MDYIDINVIADRINRNPLLDDVSFETILDYTFEFIKIVGMPSAFLEKTALIDIDQYRGKLPDDFYKMIQVRTSNGLYFRGTTDSFHMSPLKEKENRQYRNTDVTYKIQGSCIYTSMEHCSIEISYMAMPMNEEGSPLIPDNGSYARALQEYIIVELYTTLSDQGKVSLQVLQNHQQRYAFFVGQAQSDLVRPTIDQMESIANMRTKLLDSLRTHQNGYVHLGERGVQGKGLYNGPHTTNIATANTECCNTETAYPQFNNHTGVYNSSEYRKLVDAVNSKLNSNYGYTITLSALADLIGEFQTSTNTTNITLTPDENWESFINSVNTDISTSYESTDNYSTVWGGIKTYYNARIAAAENQSQGTVDLSELIGPLNEVLAVLEITNLNLN